MHAAVAWPDRLFEVLKRGGVRQIGYVPDAGHARRTQAVRGRGLSRT
jgi:hypothetical protein